MADGRPMKPAPGTGGSEDGSGAGASDPSPYALTASTAQQNRNVPGAGYGSPYVDAIVWGNSGWRTDTGPITYWFGSAADPNRPAETPLDGWSGEERTAFTAALANYAAVSNLRFEEATSEATANIVAFQVTSSTYLGLAEIPDGSVSHGGNPNQVWLRYAFNGASFAELQPGGDGYQTILHELGHALGLAHPSDGGSQADASTFPGLHEARETGLYGLNQGPFTAMTYNLGYVEAPAPSYAYGENAALGPFDIAALQRIYGANAATAPGDDVYALPTVNARGTGWTTIWDAGGTDLVSAAGAGGPAVIDLRAAPLNGPFAGGFVSQVRGIGGGLTIAAGVAIENAQGGAGADRIVGTDGDNRLDGGEGADTLIGGAGSDTLIGGAGNDLIYADGQPALASGVARTGSGVLRDADNANATPQAAINLNVLFNLGPDPDIADAATVPHVSVQASGGTGTDYYSVTIGSPGATLILDVDGPSPGLDAQVRLISPAGNVVAENDDNDVYFGAGGSSPYRGTLGTDPFIAYAAPEAGVYTIAVTRYQRAALQAGDSYRLQVSVQDAPAVGGDGGNDLVLAGDGDDTVFGGDGADLLLANLGDDLLFGNQGADTLFGGQGNDVAFGGRDADALFGNIGADVLLGNLGDDQLFGGQGDDQLFGGQGDDVLSGDLGNDVLSGDLGADRYVFGPNSGVDLVLGFDRGQGDRLDLQGQTYTVEAAANGNAVLRLSGGGTVELAGITPGQLDGGFA